MRGRFIAIIEQVPSAVVPGKSTQVKILAEEIQASR
jgi:hypothetical protein